MAGTAFYAVPTLPAILDLSIIADRRLKLYKTYSSNAVELEGPLLKKREISGPTAGDGRERGPSGRTARSHR